MRKILAWLAVALCLASGLGAQGRNALLIANGNYKSFGSLANPIPEARELKTVLERLGFSVTLLEDGSREAMAEALVSFETAVKGRGGIALFHYGGHGVQVAGKNYLVPADADIPDERRVATRALDVDEVMASLDASGAETSIVILDACRNNPLPAASGRSATRGLAVLGVKPKNSIIIYAAESGNVARDGLFTPAFARAIAAPGLSLSEVVMQVRREVYDKSEGEQTPGTYEQLFAPVYLNGAPIAGAAPAAPVPAPAAPAAPSPAAEAPEEAAYLPILDGKAAGRRKAEAGPSPFAELVAAELEVDGEDLIVSFELAGLPRSLSFNNPDTPAEALEYEWAVFLDVDGDEEDDFLLSLAHYREKGARKKEGSVEDICEPYLVAFVDDEEEYLEAEVGIETRKNRITLTLYGYEDYFELEEGAGAAFSALYYHGSESLIP